MGKLSKFDDVYVFASLSAILTQNTGFYQSDFDIDKSIITQAAASPQKEDKTLLWLCRPMGTHCFRERDVFLKDTAPHNTWRFYREQTSDRILAYAIELTGTEHGKVKHRCPKPFAEQRIRNKLRAYTFFAIVKQQTFSFVAVAA